MEPTLKLGQIVTASNCPCSPKLGEIVVFHPPTTASSSPAGNAVASILANETPYSCVARDEGERHKRPCGVPGPAPDRPLFIKRVVGLPGDRIATSHGHVIRNGKLQQEPFASACQPTPPEPNDCSFPEPITVPQGTYFVIGDNRTASADSRQWGPIRRSWIVGVIQH
jgi:signal peptidase I